MDNETNHKTVLDVEDDTQRQDRIQGLLEKLNSDTKSQAPPSPPRFEFRDRSTFAVNPPTELISRVQAFLPQIQASNEALVERVREDPDGVCIEHVERHVSEYIEMNLGLGVFESRGKGTQEGQDAEMSSTSSSSPSSEEAGQDDSDFDSDASSEIITSFIPDRPLRPLPRRSRARPQISVLEDKSGE